MVEVMKIMATSFKRSRAHTVALSAPNPAKAALTPSLRWLFYVEGHCSGWD